MLFILFLLTATSALKTPIFLLYFNKHYSLFRIKEPYCFKIPYTNKKGIIIIMPLILIDFL